VITSREIRSPRMRGRRFVFVVGGLLTALAVVVALWSVIALRTCDEDSNVRRSSLAFRLCGMDHELIASIPLRDPEGETVFSWQNADGNKPGRRWLNYTSNASSPDLRDQLTQFLKTSVFAQQGNDGEFELWGNGRTVLGFAIHPTDKGAINRVEIVHNTGLD
jgi:hypothetical protein